MSDMMALTVVQEPRQSINMPPEILDRIIKKLDPVSAVCFALASKQFMGAWMIKLRYEDRVQNASRDQDGENVSPEATEYSTSTAKFDPPFFGITLDEVHFGGNAKNPFVLKTLLKSWMPDGLVYDPFAVMYIGPEALLDRIEECKDAINDKQDELDSEKEARHDKRREEKEERQDERAERKQYVLDHKEQEYLYMEEPLSDYEGEKDDDEEDDGEERDVPELTRDDEEYWVGLKGSMFSPGRRAELIEDISDTESSVGTDSTTPQEEAFEFFSYEQQEFMLEYGYPWA